MLLGAPRAWSGGGALGSSPGAPGPPPSPIQPLYVHTSASIYLVHLYFYPPPPPSFSQAQRPSVCPLPFLGRGNEPRCTSIAAPLFTHTHTHISVHPALHARPGHSPPHPPPWRTAYIGTDPGCQVLAGRTDRQTGPRQSRRAIPFFQSSTGAFASTARAARVPRQDTQARSPQPPPPQPCTGFTHHHLPSWAHLQVPTGYLARTTG